MQGKKSKLMRRIEETHRRQPLESLLCNGINATGMSGCADPSIWRWLVHSGSLAKEGHAAILSIAETRAHAPHCECVAWED